MAPMAVKQPFVSLASAVTKAGGMGGIGCNNMTEDKIRELSSLPGPVNLNLWIPQNGNSPEFEKQFDALISCQPGVVSSIMGVFDEAKVTRLKERGISYFATVTNCGDAIEAVTRGADVLIVQGKEAGGHQGYFGDDEQREPIGLFALLPAVSDVVPVPLVAAGGIADGRTAAAAINLGAAAVMIGTALMGAPEANIPPSYKALLRTSLPEDTVLTRAFSGKLGRSLKTSFVLSDPPVDVYPLQRSKTASMTAEGWEKDDVDKIQAWAGQACRLVSDQPAMEFLTCVWEDAKQRLCC